MHARPEAFTVREATPQDHEGIIALCSEVFSAHEGSTVRHLLTAEGYGPGRWTVAVDADETVASCCTLLTHRLRYGVVEVPAAQIEFVATKASARKQGLVRAQFDLHHQWAEEQGALVLIITGIPYVYRRLGYGYAIEYSGEYRVLDVPKAPEGWTVESATSADRPALDDLERAAKARQDLTLEWPDGGWDWILSGASTWDEEILVARRDGEVDGFAYIQRRVDEGHIQVGGTARTEGAAQALVAAAATRAGVLKVYLVAREGDPWTTVVERVGVRDPAWFNAVYARIPDPAAFLDHVKEELTRRLADSAFAQSSTELALSFYEDGVVLSIADGIVTGAVRDPEPDLDPMDDDKAGIAPDALPALLLGRFAAEELELRYDDVGYVADRALMAVLFPKRSFDVWAPI
jgi:predicted N-acetyltransferase YhbS